MAAYNTFHGRRAHLGLADPLDAMTATWIPQDCWGEVSSCYRWAMVIADDTGPQPAV
jgi:hypothetical protein